jgi:hypothetical protein
VKPTTGTVLAVWKSAGDAPAVVENRFGKGNCLYVSAAEIPTSVSGLLKELSARLIGAPVVQVQSTRNYSFVMNRKGNDLLLYAMIRDTGARAYGGSIMVPETASAVGPEAIRLTLDTAAIGDIRRVDLLPEGSAVKMSRRAGSIEILVDASPSVTALRLRTEDRSQARK